MNRLGLVDRYVRGELSADDERDFEAHFFACDACFAEVEWAERLRAAVRDAVARGQLNDGDTSPEPVDTSWLWPAFVFAAAATVVLAAATAWLGFVRLPSVGRQLAIEQLAHQTNARTLDERERELRGERESRIALEGRLAAAAEPNIPVAIIQTTRDVSAPIAIRVPAGARHVVLWVEAPPSRAGEPFRLSLKPVGRDGTTTIEGLTANSEGALAVAVPAASLAPGSYVARLYAAGNSVPVGEYRIQVERAK